jgi:hypothetical protein|tara:strand:+ start:54 stop:746 length:693 start_codon:yes stop_codon:yes gene_type:complete
MANRNTVGFGLIPSGALGATPSTGGQNKYKIDSGYGSSIYLGQPVQYDTAGGANDNPGYIINGQDAITRSTIGVFNGCFYTDATTNKPTFSSYFPRTTAPANSEDVDAFIIDNPFQQYNVQLDTRLGANADAAQAEMGKTLGLTVSANGAASANSGSTLSGQSNSQLTVGTASNAVANQWRLLRSAEDPENEDLITTPQTNPALANFSGQATVVVVANLSQWFGSGSVSA